jgi:hypothetical protein
MMRRLWAAVSAGLILVTGVRAEDFMERLRALEPMIGHYPADIKGDKDAAEVKARYEALKGDLDKALAQESGSEKLLAQRGYLQAMGHNADYAGAWDGATKETDALGKDPNDVFAILALANLWVNSRPDLAVRAEMLYRAAQCNLGDAPLEEAQRGLFFAFYYQGKFQEAWRQARYLTQTWPQVKGYQTFVEIGGKAAHQKGEPKAKPSHLAMTTCENKAH